MSEIKRLTELLDKFVAETNDCTTSALAKYLIVRGVIVPPMPMSDSLRLELSRYVYNRCIEEL